MGIFSSYIKGFSDNMLGPDAKASDGQDTGKTNRFMQSLGAAAANKYGGSRPKMANMGQSFGDAAKGVKQGMVGGELDDMFSKEASGDESAYYSMSPLQRLQREAQLMMESDNPAMQKIGGDMIQKYHDKATAEGGEVKRGTSWQKATDAGFTPGTQEHQEYQKRLNEKTKMFEGAENKPYSASDLMKFSHPEGKQVPSNLTPKMAQEQGFVIKQDALQTSTGAVLDNLDLGLEDLYGAIDADEESVGLGTVLRNMPGVGGEVINAGMNLLGADSTKNEIMFTNANRKISGAIVKMMSGAAATDAERSFWEQIQPRETDSNEVKRWKYDSMLDFAEKLKDRAAKGGVTGIPDFGKIKRFGSKAKENDGLPEGVTWK